ncbi:MAG: hypothetical protein MR978_00155 [Spirochaetia bacterium]|nr:hypothetical protein [Spirochaetia bacterium]
MSDSTDNTNELDSYGVWVKRPPKDALQDDFSSPQEETESFDSSSIDLPEINDFDETSFENSSDALSESEANTISEDIFNTEEMPQTKDLSQEENNEEKPLQEESLEQSSEDISQEDGEIDLDSFMSDSSESSSEVSADDFLSSSGDGEVSLDDFMDSGSDGEIDLDAFMDDGFSSSSGSSSKKEDDVQNDDALDINVNFTDNTQDEIPVREITEEDELSSEEYSETEAEESITSQKVSTDFGESEEVDLSDFGIDSDAEETPVTDNVKQGKKSEEVDYDLAISEDDTNDSVAPVVNEVKSTSHEAEETQEQAQTVPADSTVVNNDLLKQIVNDLSGLKNELNSLKNDFAELKSHNSLDPSAPKSVGGEYSDSNKENTGFFQSDDSDETIALSGDELSNIVNSSDIYEDDKDSQEETVTEEPVVEDSVEPVDEELSINETALDFQEEQNKTQETSLPSDEKNAILESEDFVSEETSENQETTLPSDEETPILESEDFVNEETNENQETPLPSDEENAILESEDSLKNEMDFNDENPFGSVNESIEIPEEVDSQSDLSIDIDDTSLEEPDLNQIDEEESEDISIPKVQDFSPDDMFVESSSNEDFIQSVSASSSEETEDSTLLETTETSSEQNEIPSDEVIEIPEISNADDTILSEETIEENAEEISEEVNEEPVLENEIEISEETIENENDDIFETSGDSNNDEMFNENIFDSTENAEEPLNDSEPILPEQSDDEFKPLDSVVKEAEKDIFEEDSSDGYISEIMSEEPSIQESLSDENVDYLSKNDEDITQEQDSFVSEEDSGTLTLDELEDVSQGISETEETEYLDDSLSDKTETEDIFEENLSQVQDETQEVVDAQEEKGNPEILEQIQDEIPTVASITEGLTEPEENVFEKTFGEESGSDFTTPESSVSIEDAIEIENPEDNSLTQIEETNDNELSKDIKNDVKSVLLYMDKLLESLPDEKIREFAASEQFETYKKLFDELGLINK